jgi:predicted ATPase
MRICYEHAESLSRSLNRPLLLYLALIGQWRYSLVTDKLTATMQIADRVYSLAQEQNDSALMIGAYRALAVAQYFLGDFEAAQRNAIRGVEIWRSKGVQSPIEEVMTPAVVCLGHEALSDWHLGQIDSSHDSMAAAISLAKELNDMHALTHTLWNAGFLAQFERNPIQAERYASELIELSTRQNFASWLAGAKVGRGWARSVCGDTAEGIAWIEHGIENLRAAGWSLCLPYALSVKAEALHLADRSSEALETLREAEALAETRSERWWCAELHRLRGVFLTAIRGDETQIEASFCAAMRIAKEQKSVSLEKRAEGTYAEYRRQRAGASGGRRFRLPL